MTGFLEKEGDARNVSCRMVMIQPGTTKISHIINEISDMIQICVSIGSREDLKGSIRDVAY